MNKPFMINNIKDSSLEIEMNSLLFNDEESPYKYEDRGVPRVTEILSSILHEEYLMNWANFIGRSKKISHTVLSDNAAYIGSRVHAAIENYISNSIEEDFSDISVKEDRQKMYNAFLSFKRWWSIIAQNNYRVIFLEKTLVNKYYGGTLDMLIEINNRIYIVDFKTSNHFNYKYHLQTSAYRRLLYDNYGIIVDGIIILKLSKVNILFQEQVLDLTDYNILRYINDCDRCFLSLVYAYYNRYKIQSEYKMV